MVKKVEIKNLKVSYGGETTSSLHINGKRAGVVVQPGHNGPTYVELLDQSLVPHLKKFIESSPPAEFKGLDLPMTVGLYMDILVNLYLREGANKCN